MAEEPKTIGRRKYEALKRFGINADLSEERLKVFENTFPGTTIGEALKLISEYESKRDTTKTLTPEQIKKNEEYFKKIREEEPKKEPIVLTKKLLWNMFLKNYRGNYDTKSYDSLENIKALIYYFLGDQSQFQKCSRVSLESKPNVLKGLLIVGDYGNGKTSTMRAFEKCFIRTNLAFKGYTTNEVVQWYGNLETPFDKEEFQKKMQSGIRYFDDLVTERDASNYGKINIMKEILEERYDKKLRTHLSMNYKAGHEGDLAQALNQISERYGDRMYDRIFEAYNIIEFKGKSYRE